jgi:hypothetical protein
MYEPLSRPSCMFFREFRDSQLPLKGPVQQRLEEMLRLALGFLTPRQGSEPAHDEPRRWCGR